MSNPAGVVVVGGGLVGASAALAVADAGYDVCLVDRARPTPAAGAFGMDIRNIACSPASKALLMDLGVFADLDPVPYRRMQVWEDRGTAVLEFTAEEAGRDELGWILENAPTVMALWERLTRHPRVTIREGALTGLTCTEEQVVVTLPDGAIEGQLLVGVDGARSAVRELIGAATRELATGQQALATIVRTEAPHDGTALQRFLLDGPLALLPSREPCASSVVWSQSPVEAERRMALSDEAFCAELETAVERRLGRVLAVDRRVVFPLVQHVVESFNPRDRVLLIGDAARVLHPLAGLGANVGFEDVRDLSANLARLPAGCDPGRTGIWRTFARRRQVRARLMVAAMAGFRHAYAERSPTLTWLRNGTVDWINGSTLVKRQIIREALGLGPLATAW